MRNIKGDLIFNSGTNLTGYELKIQLFQLVQSGTSGEIEVKQKGGGFIDPSKYVIEMDEYAGGVDCLCNTVTGGVPNDETAQDSVGDFVNVVLSSVDNRTYTLSSAPVQYPVALIYIIKMSFVDAKALDLDYVLNREIVAPVQSVNGETGNVILSANDVGAVSKNTSVDNVIATFNGTTGEIDGAGVLKLDGGKIYPTTDSTTAIQIMKADGSTVIATLDTTNGRVGIGVAPGAYKFAIKGENDNTILIDNNGATYTTCLWANNGVTYGQLYWNNSTKSFEIGSVKTNGQVAFLYGAGLIGLYILKSGDTQIPNTKYFYQAASPTADTVNDTRFRNNAGVYEFEICTVANASKGLGTWVSGKIQTDTIKESKVIAGSTGASGWVLRNNADSANIIQVDEANGRVGIGKVPTQALDVNGSIIVSAQLQVISSGFYIGADATGLLYSTLNSAGRGHNFKVKGSVNTFNILYSEDLNHTAGKYFYQAASPTADTVNDTRFVNNSGIFNFLRCSVTNASKGLGTWITGILGAIKIGDATNNTEFEADGTMKFNGSATVWDDIDLPLIIKTTGAGSPSLTTISGNVKGYTYAVSDGLDIDATELTHRFKQAATTGKFHVHVVSNGVDATDRYVRFQFEYLHANFGSVMTGATIRAVDLLIPANTPDRTHFIFDIGDYTTLNIGSQIIGRFSRVASVGAAPTNSPFVLKFQIHAEIDTVGSRQITSK